MAVSTEVDPRLRELLEDYPEDLFTDEFYRSWELVDRYGRNWALRLARELRLDEILEVPRTLDQIREEGGFVPAFDRALGWILAMLIEADHVRREPGERFVWRTQGPPVDRLEDLRRETLATDPANEAALDLLDAAGEAYPRVARGEVSGQSALFGLGKTGLWLRYFHNDNPIYSVNNRLAAEAAAGRLPEGPFRILEVGGGGASGTRALLEALDRDDRLRDLERYRFTEPSPFFRRRAERELRSDSPELPFEFGSVDIDEEFADQGVEPSSFHLVYAVNVLHVATDLDFSLSEIATSLRPGGWLIAAESIRPFSDRPTSTEMIFLILEDFCEVELDPERRPNPGFLTAESWRRLFDDAGFQRVAVEPDAEAIREVYERFCTGVVVGRVPAEP
ncbi:MAG: methyltransferase [Thermoanaerobaculia bacterium]|nr:methyltransferase [Thermoanaerobaculia bacterium]